MKHIPMTMDTGLIFIEEWETYEMADRHVFLVTTRQGDIGILLPDPDDKHEPLAFGLALPGRDCTDLRDRTRLPAGLEREVLLSTLAANVGGLAQGVAMAAEAGSARPDPELAALCELLLQEYDDKTMTALIEHLCAGICPRHRSRAHCDRIAYLEELRSRMAQLNAQSKFPSLFALAGEMDPRSFRHE